MVIDPTQGPGWLGAPEARPESSGCQFWYKIIFFNLQLAATGCKSLQLGARKYEVWVTKTTDPRQAVGEHWLGRVDDSWFGTSVAL